MYHHLAKIRDLVAKLVSTETTNILFNFDSNNLNSYLEINADHSTVPKVLNHLMTKPDTMSDLDFLKEDMFSSPKFMIDPSKFFNKNRHST